MSNPLLEDLERNQEPNGLVLALPTLGRFYPRGVLSPDADAENIEVLPLGIAAEIHLNDPLLLAAGKSIPKIMNIICPEIQDPESLCGIDIDAVLLASRIASHGEKMRMSSTCTHCGNEDTLDVNLQEIILRYAPIEDSHLAGMIVTIPELDQKVCIQPPTYRTGLEVIRNTMTIQKGLAGLENTAFEDFIQDEGKLDTYMEIVEQNTVMSLGALIDSIFYVETSSGQKVADKEAITEWALRVKREHFGEIRRKIQELGEHIDKLSVIGYKCSGCQKENDFRLTLDPQKLFFYDPDSSKTTTMLSPTSKKSATQRKRASRTSQR